MNAVIAAFDVAGIILSEKAVKQRAEYILFKIQAIHWAPYIIGDLSDLALQRGALFIACHL